MNVGLSLDCMSIKGQSWGFYVPFKQPGSYWDRSSELPLVGLEPTEVTAYD